MAFGREDKGFKKYDWWKGKVCPLDFYTRGQHPTDYILQNAYIAILFGSFGTKSKSGGRKYVHNIDENPNFP
jgi:hypothetical protein